MAIASFLNRVQREVETPKQSFKIFPGIWLTLVSLAIQIYSNIKIFGAGKGKTLFQLSTPESCTYGTKLQTKLQTSNQKLISHLLRSLVARLWPVKQRMAQQMSQWKKVRPWPHEAPLLWFKSPFFHGKTHYLHWAISNSYVKIMLV